MDDQKIYNKQVGYYPNPFKPAFHPLSLGAVLQSFKCGSFQPYIDQARILYNQREFERYALLKHSLPAITFSGIFSPSRTISNLKEYNALIILDIDKPSQKPEQLKETIAKDEYVLAVWLSPSGNGLKMLVISDREVGLHEQVFRGAVAYFREKYAVQIDRSGCDVSRLCFVSQDPEMIIKPECKPFDQIATAKPARDLKRNRRPARIRHVTGLKSHLVNNERELRICRDIYRYLKSSNLSVTDSYHDWVRVAFALSNSFSYEVGSNYFLKFCRLDNLAHDEQESIKLINTCYKKGLSQSSFATLLYLAGKKGFVV